MNRRRFLEMLTAGAFGALTLDVDKLLWVPNAKTIFVPPVAKPAVVFHRSACSFVMSERVFFLSPAGVYAYMGNALESVAKAIDYDALMAYRSQYGLG